MAFKILRRAQRFNVPRAGASLGTGFASYTACSDTQRK
jgi:hypothetical protein